MQPNPILRQLGFAARDRVAVLHVDDVGLCQATLPAFAELVRAGAVDAASAMVPCPWFPAAAALARELPGVDLGVHLTLTSEWEGCRWGPLSTRDPASGLLDGDGFCPATAEELGERARVPAAAAEMAAQLARALAAGIDVTHLDGHMYAAFHPRLLPSYVRLGLEHSLPTVFWRDHPAVRDFAAAGGREAKRQLAEWRQRGAMAVDHGTGLPLGRLADRREQARRLADDLQPGLTHCITHPACDTPDLRALAADAPSRIADLAALLDPEVREHWARAGVHRIGYREVRAAMRQLA
jgi:predicted glycoside hydrolase/deacetylase ChbG (UPF0249 family)